MTTTEATYPRVRVYTRPNRGSALLLDFAEDCPYCGRRHRHGWGGGPLYEGTYGSRVPHCGDHTHLYRTAGRRRPIPERDLCRISHPVYILVPA